MNSRLAGPAALWVAFLAALAQTASAVGIVINNNWIVGIDYMPLRHAAHNLLTGRSIYTDHLFVYPPTAAPVLVPLAAGHPMITFRVWSFVGIAVTVATSAYLGSRYRSNRVLGAASAVFLVVGSDGATKAFDLGNISMFLAPFAVVAVASFYRGRWLLGCLVLVASLLVKPLLVPLLLVPLLNRRWRELALSFIPATVALGVAALFVPGGNQVSRFIGYVLHGTNLHGANSVNNLSLSGFAESHGLPHVVATAFSVPLLGAAAFVVWHYRRGAAPVTRINFAVLAFVTVLLTGGISEIHFFLVPLMLVILRVTLEPSRAVFLRYGLFLAMSLVPAASFGLFLNDGGNTWYVWMQLSVFIGCMIDIVAGGRTIQTDGAVASCVLEDRVLEDRDLDFDDLDDLDVLDEQSDVDDAREDPIAVG